MPGSSSGRTGRSDTCVPFFSFPASSRRPDRGAPWCRAAPIADRTVVQVDDGIQRDQASAEGDHRIEPDLPDARLLGHQLAEADQGLLDHLPIDGRTPATHRRRGTGPGRAIRRRGRW